MLLNLPPGQGARQVYVDCRLPVGRKVSGIRSGDAWIRELQSESRLVLDPGVSGQVSIVLDIVRA
jgi:hypothetical protein